MTSELIFHDWKDISRKTFIEISNAEKLVEKWERYFGSYEEIRDNVFSNIFFPQFAGQFNRDILDSTVNRYFVLEYLIKQDALDKSNLRGNVLDIGSFLGAGLDAIACFGGHVIGTDCGCFAYNSPSGKDIQRLDGRQALHAIITSLILH